MARRLLNETVGRAPEASETRMRFLDQVVGGGSIPLLEKVLSFTEARNRMLAENIANITTPGYRTKQLDVRSFQASLRDALDRQDAAERRGVASPPLELKDTRELRTGAGDTLNVTPSTEPAENILFHDGTNARIERQMALLAENTMMHQAAVELLKANIDGLSKAIRGRAI